MLLELTDPMHNCSQDSHHTPKGRAQIYFFATASSIDLALKVSLQGLVCRLPGRGVALVTLNVEYERDTIERRDTIRSSLIA